MDKYTPPAQEMLAAELPGKGQQATGASHVASLRDWPFLGLLSNARCGGAPGVPRGHVGPELGAGQALPALHPALPSAQPCFLRPFRDDDTKLTKSHVQNSTSASREQNL